MMEITILLSLFFIIFGILGWKIGEKRLPLKQQRVMERESIPLIEIYEKFYFNTGLDKEKVMNCWLMVADTLKLDPTKLRPEDKFKKEFAPVKGFPVEDELVDLEEILIEKCKQLKMDIQETHIDTLDDFIKFMCA